MTNPSVSELLIHVLRHVSTEILGAPSPWKYFCALIFLFNSCLYTICDWKYPQEQDTKVLI
jgi:hypothetical protein